MLFQFIHPGIWTENDRAYKRTGAVQGIYDRVLEFFGIQLHRADFIDDDDLSGCPGSLKSSYPHSFQLLQVNPVFPHMDGTCCVQVGNDANLAIEHDDLEASAYPHTNLFGIKATALFLPNRLKNLLSCCGFPNARPAREDAPFSRWEDAPDAIAH